MENLTDIDLYLMVNWYLRRIKYILNHYCPTRSISILENLAFAYATYLHNQKISFSLEYLDENVFFFVCRKNVYSL